MQNVEAKLVKSGSIVDGGIVHILKNGYPYKSITGDKDKDFYITQTAVWWYLDNTTGSSNLGEQFKVSGSDAYNLRKYVKALVEEGMSHTNDSLTIKNTGTGKSRKRMKKRSFFHGAGFTVAAMIAVTLLAKALGLVRQMMVAGIFAASPEGIAFSAASGIPMAVFDMLFSTAVLGSFLPIYKGKVALEPKSASLFSSSFMTL